MDRKVDKKFHLKKKTSFISIWLFFIFLNSLQTSNFSLCVSILLPSSFIIFKIITLNSFTVDCLTPLHLVLLLGFYLFPSARTCSAASIYPSCYVNFYVCDRLVMFLDAGKVAFCSSCPIHLSSALIFCHSSYNILGVSPKKAVWSFCCDRLTAWAIS